MDFGCYIKAVLVVRNDDRRSTRLHSFREKEQLRLEIGINRFVVVEMVPGEIGEDGHLISQLVAAMKVHRL